MMVSALRRAASLIAFLVCLLAATASFAQQEVDYSNWEAAASQIEEAVDGDDIGLEALDTLREAIFLWRDTFAERVDADNPQVESIQTQLEALGPPPEEGVAESSELAARREALNEELSIAQAPQIEAAAALARATALIDRIDSRIREVQANALLEYKGSPLFPSVWRDAFDRLNMAGIEVGGEIRANLAQLNSRNELAWRLPIAVVLLLLGGYLILRGPAIIENLVTRVERNVSEQGKVVYGFLVSLGTILLPLIGISLMNVALISTGILGPVGQTIAISINIGIFVFSIARWLASRIYPERPNAQTPMHLTPEQHKRGRSLTQMGAVLLALVMFLDAIDDIEGHDGLVISVMSFPVFVGLGVVLFLMGRLIREGRTLDDYTNSYADYLLGITGRVVQVIGVIGPIASAAGFYNVAGGLLIPASQTLYVFGFLAALHAVVRASFGLIRGLTPEESESALTPVLVSFAFTIMMLPLLALAWGARQADLAELWTRFLAGVQLGETTITPGAFVTVIVVFMLGMMVTRLLQGVLRNSVLPRTGIDKGGRNAIVSGIGYVGVTLAALGGITAAGIDLSAFAIIVGALGVGIGFGLQNIVNNFVSGIILLIERPIGEGDWVDVNGSFGVVKSISVRSTVIETFDRTDVIVPNGDLVSGTVTNWTRGNQMGRVIVPVGVAYGTDTRAVEKILMEIAEAHPIVAVNPAPVVLFRNFGADSLEFEIRAILTDVNFLVVVQSDLNHEIARRFAEEGIEIPFAQRDIWLRNPEALTGMTHAGTPTTPPSEPRPPSDLPDLRVLGGDAGDGD